MFRLMFSPCSRNHTALESSVTLPRIKCSQDTGTPGTSLKMISKNLLQQQMMLKGNVFERCHLAPVVGHGCCVYSQGCALWAGEKLIVTAQMWQCRKMWEVWGCCCCFCVSWCFVPQNSSLKKKKKSFFPPYISHSQEKKKTTDASEVAEITQETTCLKMQYNSVDIQLSESSCHCFCRSITALEILRRAVKGNKKCLCRCLVIILFKWAAWEKTEVFLKVQYLWWNLCCSLYGTGTACRGCITVLMGQSSLCTPV